MPLGEDVSVGRGIDGVSGSGVYSCGAVNEETNRKVEELLTLCKEQGLVENIWRRIQDDSDAALNSTVM